MKATYLLVKKGHASFNAPIRDIVMMVVINQSEMLVERQHAQVVKVVLNVKFWFKSAAFNFITILPGYE